MGIEKSHWVFEYLNRKVKLLWYELNFSSKMSLNSSTSGRNPDALENIQLLKDGVKFSDVFSDGEDILDSEDLRIEFNLNILRCQGTDKGDIISESFSLQN